MKARIQHIVRRGRRRDVERVVEADAALLVIGRSPSCDLVLTDLSAALRHAELMITGDRVRIVGTGGSVFRIGSRVTGEAEFSLAASPLVDIAGHRLAFRAAGEGVEIDIEDCPRDGRLQSLKGRDAFALTGGRGGRRIASWALFVLVLAVGLALPWTAYGPDGEGGTDRSGGMMASARDTSGSMPLAAALWTSGALSSSHRTLSSDCKACHVDAFVSVRDETCMSCHSDLSDHAPAERLDAARPAMLAGHAFLAGLSDRLGRPPERCTSCHIEHNAAHGVTPSDQALCADCHDNDRAQAGLTNFAPVADFGRLHPEFRPTLTGADGAANRAYDMGALIAAQRQRAAEAARAGGPAAACDGFELGRPNFRGGARLATAGPGDGSGLVFPHAVHLDADGCVAGLIERMGAGSPYGAALTCADCHTPEAGGALFEPVSMEEDCAACHSLVFETVNGFSRTLRHGQPEDVVASMLDFYQAQAIDGLSRPEPERNRPGGAGLRPAGLREQAFAQANARAAERVAAIFSPGGACFGCHEITRPEGARGLDFQVTPVRLRDSFHPFARFSHSSHASTGCASCHDAESSGFAEDVLLPSVETCRLCHGGEHATDRTPSTCIDCHGYHGVADDAPAMVPATMNWSRKPGLR